MPTKKHETDEVLKLREQKQDHRIFDKKYKQRCIREAKDLMRFHATYSDNERKDELLKLKSKLTAIANNLAETENELRSIHSGMQTHIKDTDETKLNTTIMAENIATIQKMIIDFQRDPSIETAMTIFIKLSHVRHKIATNSSAFYSVNLHPDDLNRYKDLHKIEKDITVGDAKKYKKAMVHFKNINLYIFDEVRHIYNESHTRQVKTVSEIYEDFEKEREERIQKKLDKNSEKLERKREKDEEDKGRSGQMHKSEEKAAILARKKEREKKENIKYGPDGKPILESQLSTEALLMQMKAMQLSM
jgi:hypothetical protein